MTLLERIKSQLGISHDRKDGEIDANVQTAKAELIRLGVSPEMAAGNDALVEDAVCQFVLSRMAPSERDIYAQIWDDLKDSIRRSSGYAGD